MATDAIEVEPREFGTEPAFLRALKEFDRRRPTISDFKTLNIDSDAALVTYLVTMPEPKPA